MCPISNVHYTDPLNKLYWYTNNEETFEQFCRNTNNKKENYRTLQIICIILVLYSV
jgi:hypothetical protein